LCSVYELVISPFYPSPLMDPWNQQLTALDIGKDIDSKGLTYQNQENKRVNAN